MADVKITQLPAALSVNDTDNLILDDGSSTYRVAADLLKEYMIGDIPADIDAAVAAANKNLAPAYNASSTYAVGDLVTYSGKLYKCIVAVTTPEAFNINKWDDVTTSEVFVKSDTAIYSYTDGTTFSDIIAGLFNTITSLGKIPKRLERYVSGSASIRFYSVGLSSSGTLEIVNIRSESGVLMFNIATHITSQNRNNWHSFNVSATNGVTFDDNSNSPVTGDGYFKIYFE